ncbi:hypothetical protein Hamer_G026010, partial [Homarus americanus]
ANDDEAKKAGLDQPIRNLLLSEIFWDRVDGFLKLLKPIADAINGDNKHLSIGPKIFSDLEQAFKDNISSSPVLKSEEECLMSTGTIPKRRKFLLQPIHLAANLLDPHYRGSHISGEESIDAMEVIHNIATTNPHVDESKVLGELADYRSKENLFA